MNKKLLASLLSLALLSTFHVQASNPNIGMGGKLYSYDTASKVYKEVKLDGSKQTYKQIKSKDSILQVLNRVQSKDYYVAFKHTDNRLLTSEGKELTPLLPMQNVVSIGSDFSPLLTTYVDEEGHRVYYHVPAQRRVEIKDPYVTMKPLKNGYIVTTLEDGHNRIYTSQGELLSHKPIQVGTFNNYDVISLKQGIGYGLYNIPKGEIVTRDVYMTFFTKDNYIVGIDAYAPQEYTIFEKDGMKAKKVPSHVIDSIEDFLSGKGAVEHRVIDWDTNVSTAVYKQVIPVPNHEDTFIAQSKENGKFGIITEKKKVIAPFIYDNISYPSTKSDILGSDTFYVVKQNGSYYIATYDKQFVVHPTAYESIQLFKVDGLYNTGIVVGNKGTFKLLDPITLEPKFTYPVNTEYVASVNNESSVFVVNGKYGIIDFNGHVVVEPVYDGIVDVMASFRDAN